MRAAIVKITQIYLQSTENRNLFQFHWGIFVLDACWQQIFIPDILYITGILHYIYIALYLYIFTLQNYFHANLDGFRFSEFCGQQGVISAAVAVIHFWPCLWNLHPLVTLFFHLWGYLKTIKVHYLRVSAQICA